MSVAQVEGDEVSPAAHLPVVQQDAVGRARQEPDLEGEGHAHVLQGGQLQVRVAVEVGDHHLAEGAVHWGRYSL